MKRLFAILLVFALVLPVFPAKAAEPATVTITSMVLRPSCAGVYYKCQLTGDTSNVAAWGIAMSTKKMPENLVDDCLYTRQTGADTGNGALLKNILRQDNSVTANEANAEMTIYGRPYVETTDGQILFGEGVCYTLRQLLTAVDTKVAALTDAQTAAVADLYEDYIGITHKWALPNLHNTYAEGLALNSYDAALMDTSIEVLEDSTFSGMDLANRFYTHAFTATTFVKNNVPADAPAQLAAGTATEELQKMVVSCDNLTENNLMSGDILFADDQIYVYGAGSLRSLNGTGAPKVDTLELLASDADFTLVRPAIAFTVMGRSDPTAKRDELTEKQQALIATATAYWLRGQRLQYADTRFTTGGSNYDSEFRWQSTVNTPEDCTQTDWAYTNCAAFTYEVYYQTFGYRLPNNMYTTANLAKYAASNGMEVFAYNRTKGSTQTEEEQAQVKETFFSTLQPGDIICIRRENSTGHALLYIGNGEILHSGGGTYTYTGSYGVESYEASVRRVRVENYFFNPDYSTGGDVFAVATKLQIIRPLNVMTNGINENTQNRLENLDGIVAEKISSHVRAQTADKGETVTFTYAMHNLNDKAVTLQVKETVPSQLEHISGGTKAGNQLTWNVTVPAHGRASVSYTAKVKTDVAYGTKIQSTESYVGGVRVKCEPVTVGKKLTDDDGQMLIRSFNEIKENGTTLTGLALVNGIYADAIGVSPFASTDFATVTRGEEGCFKYYMTYSSKTIYQLNPAGDYAKLLAPGLYGGYRLWASEFANDRTRLARPQDLQIGDVLLGKTSSSEIVMLYLGEDIGFINMSTLAADTVTTAARLERLLAYGNYYAIMRPMQALQ